ncbi:MAG: hypothetical protein H6838_11435 [Planctomycetes bacterium]|nr:hypothetical protein [Planctomycetota bacterium]MCB9886097.1 hypothetical protein [Planctomycetota bacterium]
MNPTSTAALLLTFAASLAAQNALPTGAFTQPQGVPLAKAWPEALRLAKQHKAPILAFVVPAKGARTDADTVSKTCDAERKLGMLSFDERSLPPMRTQREVLLRQVQLLRAPERAGRGMPEPSRTQALFALAVPVFASAEACGAEGGETVVLCGEDGRRVRGWRLDLLDRDAFVERVGEQLMSPEALAPRQVNVPPALAADLRAVRELRQRLAGELSDEQRAKVFEERGQRLARLRSALPGVGPALVHFDAEKQPQLSAEIVELEPERVPLGVTARVFDGDPCPGCGMGYVPPGLRTVLELIGP